MKNKYTARFYDYYGFEFSDRTKSFDAFADAKSYFLDVCNEHAIPFAQLDKNEQAISINGRRIGSDCDSRRYA